MIAMIKDKYGLSYGDICGLLKDGFGKGTHKDNRRFKNHLAKHRREILTFLYHDDIEATNWPAEQVIRPAVRNRKLFGGNRAWSGAAAQECLGSFFATCGKNAIASLDALSRIICRPILTA